VSADWDEAPVNWVESLGWDNLRPSPLDPPVARVLPAEAGPVARVAEPIVGDLGDGA
jgi:hypothetical protein